MANYLLTGEKSGMWKKVKKEKVIPGGSGGGKFVVTLTENDGTWTADKTVAEIVEAHDEGKICVAVGDFPGVEINFEIPLCTAFNMDDGSYVIFGGIVEEEIRKPISMMAAGYAADTADQWECGTSDLTLPEYSADDNGKVLGIVDGGLAWVNP